MLEGMLQLEGLGKRFGAVQAVDGVTLEVPRGHVLTLLGPSGCGKTTTLRMIAGLEQPDTGRVMLSGKVVADAARRQFVAPHRRNMGMVFQSYAIWPHMTVFDNVAYPLTFRGVARATIRDRVTRVLDLVGMAALADRPAPLLSGGQQQRVALCRALVYEPDLLLLDEPFSNLDSKLRQQMRLEVKLLQQQLGITVLFVTHDQVEALSMSDAIAVMNQGRVEQVGPPHEVYDRPATPFVRDFLGQTLKLGGHVVAEAPPGYVGLMIEAPGQPTFYSPQTVAAELVPGSAAYLSIRPEDLVVSRDNGATSADRNRIDGTIEALLFVGNSFEARIALPTGEGVLLPLQRAEAWQVGDRVCLSWPMDLAHIWPG